MNAEEGFRRITKIVSLVVLIIFEGFAVVGVVIMVIEPEKTPFYAVVLVALGGLAAYFAVWGLFFLFRWIVRGFVGKSD